MKVSIEKSRSAYRNRQIYVIANEPTPSIPMLFDCDPGAIIELFDNLLENALKYATHGSHVVISISASPRLRLAEGDPPWTLPQPGTRFTVQNLGPCVPERDKIRIFEPYTQANNEPAGRSVAGTGMGLAICNSIAEAHGGRISVSSHTLTGGPEILEDGTVCQDCIVRFHVDLPISKSADGVTNYA
jgi:signal transduction histidine kinase